MSGDAHHMVLPPEDGAGAYLSMQRALKNAGISPSQVDYVNAHATSTVFGDRIENGAIRRLMLSEEGHSSASRVNISSTKGSIGHLLGAAGAVESIFTILAIHENTLPPTLNLENYGEGDFDCNYIPNEAQQGVVNVALTNSFGFGGTNATLVFAKYDG
jgi:3-oxoacyl-[acyl-carrier-protein] synthase II